MYLQPHLLKSGLHVAHILQMKQTVKSSLEPRVFKGLKMLGLYFKIVNFCRKLLTWLHF